MSNPFRDPSKPAYWTTPIPREVKYAPPGNLTIQRVLAGISDKRDLKNTIVLLQDPDDEKRPSFVITTLRARFFPRGNWYASLYHAPSIYPDDYRLIGLLSLYLEPCRIAYWQTWCFLARYLRDAINPFINTHPWEHEGLLIAPTLEQIALLYGEESEHTKRVIQKTRASQTI